MTDEFALDAHAIVWYLEGNPRLGSQAKMVMDGPDNEFILPVTGLQSLHTSCRAAAPQSHRPPSYSRLSKPIVEHTSSR